MAKEQESLEYRRALDEHKAKEKQYARTQKRFYRQKAALRISTGFFTVSFFLTILTMGLIIFTGANSDSEGMLKWVFMAFVYGGGLIATIGVGAGITALVMAMDEKAPGEDKVQIVFTIIGCGIIAALFFSGLDPLITLIMRASKFIP